MPTSSDTHAGAEFDVIVIGAGFSGACFAIKAAELGLRLKVLDALPEYPDWFRAEKLETDQSRRLDALGLDPYIRPAPARYIDEVVVYRGRTKRVRPQERHRGMDYSATVNALRDKLQRDGLLTVDAVSDIDLSGAEPIVHTKSGASMRSKSIVVATGLDKRLNAALGFEDDDAEAMRTTSFGFYVEPEGGGGFSDYAFNARPARWVDGFDFATFFPIGEQKRVNVFTCWEVGDDRCRRFRQSPDEMLADLFPRLKDQVGAFRVCSKVQFYSALYYRRRPARTDCVAVIGDAYQSVSPATGMGISKCLTDVSVLRKRFVGSDERGEVPPNFDDYFQHPFKQRVDNRARDAWQWCNERSTSRSLSTRSKVLYQYARQTWPGRLAIQAKRRLIGRR